MNSKMKHGETINADGKDTSAIPESGGEGRSPKIWSEEDTPCLCFLCAFVHVIL